MGLKQSDAGNVLNCKTFVQLNGTCRLSVNQRCCSCCERAASQCFYVTCKSVLLRFSSGLGLLYKLMQFGSSEWVTVQWNPFWDKVCRMLKQQLFCPAQTSMIKELKWHRKWVNWESKIIKPAFIIKEFVFTGFYCELSCSLFVAVKKFWLFY